MLAWDASSSTYYCKWITFCNLGHQKPLRLVKYFWTSLFQDLKSPIVTSYQVITCIMQHKWARVILIIGHCVFGFILFLVVSWNTNELEWFWSLTIVFLGWICFILARSPCAIVGNNLFHPLWIWSKYSDYHHWLLYWYTLCLMAWID